MGVICVPISVRGQPYSHLRIPTARISEREEDLTRGSDSASAEKERLPHVRLTRLLA